MNADLSALGMACAFDPACADFMEMCTSDANLWLSEVKHKAYIRVDEVGTEAGAATITLLVGGSLEDPVLTFRMIVDHPFFYVIRDDATGCILFMGTILRPE